MCNISIYEVGIYRPSDNIISYYRTNLYYPALKNDVNLR